MSADLNHLEADVAAARMRLSDALQRLAADASPTSVGGSAARVGLSYAGTSTETRLAGWFRDRPVLSVACVLGLMLVVGRLGEAPTPIGPPPVDPPPID